MSNIAFITTRKHIASYDITALLQEINQRRFDGKMTVKSDENCWSIDYPDWDATWDGIDYYEESPKKLSAKHPHTSWMSYVFVVFNEELAFATNGTLSDEGISERWKPEPKTYHSWDAWIDILHEHIDKNQMVGDVPVMEWIKKLELKNVPKGMERY